MSDDDIEIVENTVDPSRPGNDDICQLCSTNLRGKRFTERLDHYSSHKTGLHTASALQLDVSAGSRTTKRERQKPASVGTSQRSMRFRKSAERSVPEDIFWYPTQAKASPDNYTPGVLSILKVALKRSHTKGSTQRAVLCYERTPHIYRESFDTNWGCGYRNFLMVCAALMDQQSQTLYFPCLDDPLPPSVRNLQRWLEDAWKLGYDEVGADHFERQLAGTDKRIGTGEIYVAFTSRKIPCVLLDFDLKKSPKGFDTLTEWVVNYFTEKPEGDVNKILRVASPVVATGKMPVIMQYDGHSLTIVGYELARNGKINLLVFNPSSKFSESIRQAALHVSTSVNSSPILLGKSKRHDRSKSPAPKKRSRVGDHPDDGVVKIPDSGDEGTDNPRQAVALKSSLDPDTIIKAFRLKKPKNKHIFQLLYFTMDDPLSDEEQNNRKIVFSTPVY